MGSTGQSVPKGTWTPNARILCHAYAPCTRYSPNLSCAQRLSEMACEGCIEAMTPKSRKRAKSRGETTCACSTRWRVVFDSLRAARSYSSNEMVKVNSPFLRMFSSYLVKAVYGPPPPGFASDAVGLACGVG